MTRDVTQAAISSINKTWIMMHQFLDISNLPPELLQEIFSYTVSHSGQVTITSLSYRSPASPFSISHVCTRWRRIALDLPHLWSHLLVMESANDSVANLVEKWIRRAGFHPLHLSLVGYGSAIFAVLYVYLASITRCRSFEVQCSIPGSYLSFLLPTTLSQRQNLVHLENLSVTWNYWDADPSTFFLSPLFGAPNLRSATWIGLDYQLLDPICRNWVNLRELTLGSIQPLEPLLSAISYCQVLERLTIYRRIVCPQYNIPTLTLPHLTYLQAPFEPLVRPIFDFLITPSLKELQVLAANCPQWIRIATFLERSAATLEVFKVHELERQLDNFNEQRFMDALQTPCFHNLKELEINFPITLYTIFFLTLPTQTIPTQAVLIDSADIGRWNRLQHLVRLSLTFSREFLSESSLTKLVVSRGGSSCQQLVAKLVKDWMAKRSFYEEVTFTGSSTQVTFRWVDDT